MESDKYTVFGTIAEEEDSQKNWQQNTQQTQRVQSGGLDDSSAHGDSSVPFTVFTVDGQPLQVILEPEDQGSLLMRLDTADLDNGTQNAEQTPTDSEQLKQNMQQLDVLRDMGITVQASLSMPFIGQLVVRVKGIREWKARKTRVHVQMHFESDKSKAVASSSESKRGNIVFGEDATFAFVRLFSQSNLTIVIKDKNPGPRISSNILAGVELALAGLKQGKHDLTLQIHRQDRLKTRMGQLDIQLDYKFLRGTYDKGNYDGPTRIYIEPRRMRAKLNINSGVEYISNVNHWLLSHDNIYCVSEPVNDEDRDQLVSASSFIPSQTLPSQTRDRWFWAADSLKEMQQYQSMLESAQDKVFTSNMMDALQPKEKENPDIKDLKEKMLACMVMFSNRIGQLEQQQEYMMGIIKQLCGQNETEQQMVPHISGRFEYGFGRPARHRQVSIIASGAPNCELADTAHFLGNHKTDNKGLLEEVPLPDSIFSTLGHYNVSAFLPEDNTFAKGSLFMLKKGTPCIVFDLDGTITVGDKEVVTQFALNALGGSLAVGDKLPKNYDLKPRHHALSAVRMWAAKGYQPIYLSGRQGSFYNLTLEWLLKHGYPPGPIHLTRSHMPTLPVYYSVGNFKVQYIETLKQRGMVIYAAYGNTGTDIRAYEAVGIPKDRTYIIGPHGGKGGTVAIDNFMEHTLDIMKHPDANPAIPYTELVYAQLPTYKRSGNRRRSQLANSVSGMVPSQDSDVSEQSMQYYDGKNKFKVIESFADSEFDGETYQKS